MTGLAGLSLLLSCFLDRWGRGQLFLDVALTIEDVTTT